MWTLGDFISTVENVCRRRLAPAAQLNQPLITVLKSNKRAILDIQDLYGGCCAFVICQTNKINRGYLLYDGRHADTAKIIYVKLSHGGALLKCKTTSNVLPNKIGFSKKLQARNLWDIVNVVAPLLPPPTNRQETINWLRVHNVLHYTTVRWCYYIYPTTGRPLCIDWIIGATLSTVTPHKININIEAFTGANNTLCFRPAYQRRPSPTPPTQPSPPSLPSPPTNNRASGFSLTLSGLSQAFRLGFVTSKEELSALSCQLSANNPRVWFHLDSDGNICHAALLATAASPVSCFEIRPPDSDNFASWTAFFDAVWSQCENIIIPFRQTTLAPIIHKFNPSTTGTFYKCLHSLQNYIKRITIQTYASNDKTLHALKLVFAHYVCAVKCGGGITLKTTNQNDIICLTSLSTNGGLVVSFENISHLLQQAKTPIHPYQDEGQSLIDCCWSIQQWAPPPHKPVIHSGSSLTHTRTYVPGRIIQYRPSLATHLEFRSRHLLNILSHTFCAISTHLCDKYSIDITTLGFQTLACLSLKCVQLSFYDKGGPLSQSIEKTKSHYAQQIRTHSRGGFSYSFCDSLNYGEPLGGGSNDPPALGIQEYDVTSCYGFSACNMKAPGGFCVGYTKNDRDGVLYRTDTLNRTNTFEFRGCMYLLYNLTQVMGLPVRSVYSNFSPLGLFYIDKYPIDLVVVLDNQTRDTFVIQYDGQFTHGCSGACPPLNRYANDATHSQLVERTNIRNQVTNAWIEDENQTNGGLQRFFYFIFTDCHDAEFRPGALSSAFTNIPQLRELTVAYKQLSPGRFGTLNLAAILSAHQDLTYLLVGSGHVPLEKRGSSRGRLLVWKQRGEKWVQDFGWETAAATLFTRDTLENAVYNYGFSLDTIECCYFYRRCHILPQVYQELIDERINTNIPAKAKFIKSIINYSVGVMGYNPAKQSTFGNAKISNKVPALRASNCDNVSCLHVGTVGSETYLLKRSFRPQGQRDRPVNNALPIFASIVEFGKLRMQQIADFWDTHCAPGSIRICYSQVDNFIVALSAPTLFDTVPQQAAYLEAAKLYFVDDKPGHIKLVWSANKPGWRFVSPSPCNYALIGGGEHWKMGAVVLSDSSAPDTAYQIQTKLLGGHDQRVDLQTRRIDKLCNTHTKTISINLHPNK